VDWDLPHGDPDSSRAVVWGAPEAAGSAAGVAQAAAGEAISDPGPGVCLQDADRIIMACFPRAIGTHLPLADCTCIPCARNRGSFDPSGFSRVGY
jgi:hypothetical protein